MTDALINPSAIPVFTGDLDQLDKDVSTLRSKAVRIRSGGTAVHSRFQLLEAHYTAPEAGDLFASTLPVSRKADDFAAKLETVADALAVFSGEARPLAAKLKQLKADAVAFVATVGGDDEWTYDEHRVAEHNRLVSGVNAAEAAFREAERTAATKITAIVGGTRFVEDDGRHLRTDDVVMYGYSATTLDRAGELPWGSPVGESHHWWELDQHARSFFYDGLLVDNIWGGLRGLATLAGYDGGEAAGDAWGHLGDIAGGIGQYAFTPGDALLDWVMGEDEPSEAEARQKQAAKDFAKGLIAYDLWGEDPARASATVVFNGLTLGLAPLAGTARAGEAGAASRAASATARAGQYLDPVYAAARATGTAVRGLPRLSEVTTRLQSVLGTAFDTGPVHSTLEVSDGTRVRIEDGEFIRLDADGTRLEDVPRRELSFGERVRASEVPLQRERAEVGAHQNIPATGTHAGDPAGVSGPGDASAPGEADPRGGGYSRDEGLSSGALEPPQHRASSGGTDPGSGGHGASGAESSGTGPRETGERGVPDMGSERHEGTVPEQPPQERHDPKGQSGDGGDANIEHQTGGEDGVSNRVRPPREGDTNYVVDDPGDWSDTITDIDSIKGGVLWEEKTATGQDPRINKEKWVAKHVIKKLDSYVRARRHMAGFENAPIGVHFTEPGVHPDFRAAVEATVERWRQMNPDVEVQVRWSE